MALKISNDCVACGFCYPECKNEAIYEGEVHYEIDPDKCTACVGWYETPRCISICAIGACVPDPDHKENHTQLLAKWHKLHSGQIPDET